MIPRTLSSVWVSFALVLLSPSAHPATEVAKLRGASATTGDRFGTSVAIWGETAIIGSFFDDQAGPRSGSAYVFSREAGVWTQQAKLLAADPSEDGRFGSSVSIAGDTAVVGSFGEDNFTGAVYVFTRNMSGVWTQQARLVADGAGLGSQFGIEVAVSGDTLVAGASTDPPGGSAYVFTRNGEQWTQQAKLTADDTEASDGFGQSVAISGDTVVVGAIFDDDSGFASGSAYVFTRSSGTWAQQAKVLASDGTELDRFGRSVALANDVMVVGAWGDSELGPLAGSAYVFSREGDEWTQEAKLQAADTVGGDRFGLNVSIDRNIVVVGADQESRFGTGAAYVFRSSDGLWTQEAKLTSTDGAPADSFGSSVAIFANAVVVGAPRDDDDGDLSGSAYVFSIPADIRQVSVDVRPANGRTCLRLDGHGVVPVAILGEPDFDASSIDVDSLSLGGLDVRVRRNGDPLCHLDYANEDSILDLMCQFEDSLRNWDLATTEVMVTGALYDGTKFEGEDSICIALKGRAKNAK